METVGLRKAWIALLVAGTALGQLACNGVPALPKVGAASGPRSGTQVGIAAVFFADFEALARAGKLKVLAPFLVKAIANGTFSDMLNVMQILANEDKAAPYANALGQLLNANDQAPLSAVLAENGPIHLFASDRSAPLTISALAALSRTGVLRQVGYQALGTTLQSPLVASLLPDLAEVLGEGGPDLFSYAGAAMALTQHDAHGNTVPIGIANADLLLELQNEGRIHPLIDPWTNALTDPALAEGLRAAGAIVDDLRNNPQDLAAFDSAVDALGPILGKGLIDNQLTSPDGVSPSSAQLLLDAAVLGSATLNAPVVVPGGDNTSTVQPLQASIRSLSINALDAVQQMLGPNGSVGLQGLQALQAAQAGTDPNNSQLPVDQLIPIFQPYLTNRYCNGQPAAVGTMCGTAQIENQTPVGYVQMNHVVSDSFFAYLDNTTLNSFVAQLDNASGGLASTILSQTFQCGTIDAVNPNPITAIPSYPFSVSLEFFDDVNSVHVPGMPDDLASTERMTFLSCFFSRQGRLPTFLKNLQVNGTIASILSFLGINLPDIAPNDPNSINNPTSEYIQQMDPQGMAMLGAMFDPDFNLAYTDETALGPHIRIGPLRLLSPLFRVLENTPHSDPQGIYTNLLRYFIALTSVSVGTSYTGPDGQTHPLVGDLITPFLPLLAPLISHPTPQASAGNQLFTLFWDTQQNLPVDGSTVQGTLVTAIAEALQQRQNSSYPPLWQSTLDALTAHKDELDRTSAALWPDGGAFALDNAPGSPLVAADVLISGTNDITGLSSTFAGAAPNPSAPAQLEALLGVPLNQNLTVLSDLRAVDPNSNVYWQGQRLFAAGAGNALSVSGAATLRVPGILGLTQMLLNIELLPQTVDLIELVDQAQLTPGVLSLGDTLIQAGAAPEALDLAELTLQDASTSSQ